MKTGSLRARVTLTTLALLAIVLAAVVTTVTLAYRARLDGDLRSRLTAAGALVEHAGSAGQVKPLVPGLALEGIATHFSGFRSPPRPAARKNVATGTTTQARGSLLVLHEVLTDGMAVTLSASRRSVDHAVTNLLLVELLVSLSLVKQRP